MGKEMRRLSGCIFHSRIIMLLRQILMVYQFELLKQDLISSKIEFLLWIEIHTTVETFLIWES